MKLKHEEEKRKGEENKEDKDRKAISGSLKRFIKDVKSENTEYDGYILSIADNLP
jgi:uncharacterized protein YaiI (UPF0178 family)